MVCSWAGWLAKGYQAVWEPHPLPGEIMIRNPSTHGQKLVSHHLGKARQGKFIYIAHFIHSGNSKCFT